MLAMQAKMVLKAGPVLELLKYLGAEKKFLSCCPYL